MLLLLYTLSAVKTLLICHMNGCETQNIPCMTSHAACHQLIKAANGHMLLHAVNAAYATHKSQ
jgi:hypothetical protein